MKWIRPVLLKIQRGHDSVHRRTDGQGEISIPPFQLRWSGGYKNAPENIIRFTILFRLHMKWSQFCLGLNVLSHRVRENTCRHKLCKHKIEIESSKIRTYQLVSNFTLDCLDNTIAFIWKKNKSTDQPGSKANFIAFFKIKIAHTATMTVWEINYLWFIVASWRHMVT